MTRLKVTWQRREPGSVRRGSAAAVQNRRREKSQPRARGAEGGCATRRGDPPGVQPAPAPPPRGRAAPGKAANRRDTKGHRAAPRGEPGPASLPHYPLAAAGGPRSKNGATRTPACQSKSKSTDEEISFGERKGRRSWEERAA